MTFRTAPSQTSSSSSSSSPLADDSFIWTSPPLPPNTTPTSLPSKLKNYEESALHCPICQQFYNNAVTLTCQHSFCSECIQKSMGEIQARRRGRCCPVCNAKIEKNLASSLTPNYALQVAVNQYKDMRELLYRNVVQGLSVGNDNDCTQNHGCVERSENVEHMNGLNGLYGEEKEDVKTNSPIITSSKRPRRSCRKSDVNYEEDQDLKEEDKWEKNGSDIVNHTIQVNTSNEGQEQNEDSNSTPTMNHEESTEVQSTSITLSMPSNINPSSSSSTTTTTIVNNNNISTAIESRSRNKMKPMAMISLHGIKKKKLITMLEKHGLPSHGSDSDRRARYKQFVDLWNSECSAMNPRDGRELVNLLISRERQEKQSNFQRASSYEKKSVAELTGNKSFMSGFDALIKQVREQKKGGNGTGIKRQFSDISQAATTKTATTASPSYQKKVAANIRNSSSPSNKTPTSLSRIPNPSTSGRIMNPYSNRRTAVSKVTTTTTTTKSLSQTSMQAEERVLSQNSIGMSSTSTSPKTSSFRSSSTSNNSNNSNESFRKQKIQSSTNTVRPAINVSTPSLSSKPQRKGGMWDCHVCTYSNKIMHHQRRTRPRCGMCNTVRDESKEASSSVAASVPAEAGTSMIEIDC